MIRRLLLAALLCCFAWSALAVPARVQGGESGTGFAASVTVTLGAAVTSGNALALMVTTNVAGTPTLSDNGAGGSATYVLVSTSAAQGGFTAYMFYALNVTHAPTTITATPTSSGGINLIVDEVSGVATTSALDGSGAINNQPTAPNTTDGITSGSITTATNGDFIWSGSFVSAGVPLTQGTGYSAGSNLSGFTFFGSEFKVQSTAGVVAATFTTGTNNTPAMTGIFALKPPAAGGPKSACIIGGGLTGC